MANNVQSDGGGVGFFLAAAAIVIIMVGGFIVLPFKKQAEADNRSVATIEMIKTDVYGNYDVTFGNGEVACINPGDTALLQVAREAMDAEKKVRYHEEGHAQNPEFAEFDGATCMTRITELEIIE